VAPHASRGGERVDQQTIGLALDRVGGPNPVGEHEPAGERP
jgi:hypothetical protein